MFKTLAVITVLAVSPVQTRLSCSSICHFFVADALVKLCPNLKPNRDFWKAYRFALSADRAGTRIIQRETKRDLLKYNDLGSLCAPECFNLKPEDQGGTPCQYLEDASDD
jgi:hypothetical protein